MQATSRLQYRRIGINDAEFILDLLTSPGWLKYIGDRGVYDQEGARHYISNNILPAYANQGCGPYLAIRKSDGVVVGNVGVYNRPGLELPDFGFAFLPQYHGQGYAFEAAMASLEYAFEKDHQELLAITMPTNAPSLKLLAKLGFSRDEDLIRLPNNEEDLILLRKTLAG